MRPDETGKGRNVLKITIINMIFKNLYHVYTGQSAFSIYKYETRSLITPSRFVRLAHEPKFMGLASD